MTSVLLYSGGLDSYCLAALEQPDVLLSMDTGTAYGAVEQAVMKTPPGLEDRLITARLPLAQWERPSDLILPGRNAYLVLSAAQYGDTIMLAATAGDRVKDKDEPFRDYMNALLRHIYSPQWWLPEGRPVELVLPLKHLTKRQIVARYVAAGHDPALLATDTFSCYDPEGFRCCGWCKPCRRKWVALVINGVYPGFDASESVAVEVDAELRSGKWARGADEHLDNVEALDLYHGKKKQA